MENYGDTPYSERGFQVDSKRLFYSDIKNALKKMITLAPGYGILEAGTVVGVITESTSRKGQHVPYAMQTPSAGLDFIGGAYLLADGASDTTLLEVTLPDSYKFAVGDHIAGVDSDATPLEMAAITGIDRTTYSNKATITIAEKSMAALTAAAGAFIFIQTQLATPWTNATAILTAGVDTGVGEKAKGAQGSVVISNAMLYKGLLPNYDSDVLTDLGGVVDGQYLVMK